MIVDRAERECPSDEQLAAWIEGRGMERERDTVAAHVAACHACADVVASVLPSDDSSVTARVAEADLPADAPAGNAVRRTMRWAIAATVLLATAAAAYAAIDAAASRARDALAARAGAALGQPVTIGHVGLTLRDRGRTLELRLRDTRLGDGAELAVANVGIQVPLASLMARAPIVSRVVLVGATMVLGTGGTGGPFGVHLGGGNAAAAALGTVPLELVDSTLRVDSGGASMRFEHVAGTTTPEEGSIAVSIAGTLGGAPITAEGSLPTNDTGALSMTIAARQLTYGALPWVDGRLSGSGDLSMRVTGTPRAPAIAGRALVRDGRARGWNPVAGALAGEAADAVRVVAPELAGDDLRFDELRIAFISTPDGWRVPRLFVANSAIVAGATVQIGAAATLTGDGTVQLSAPAARAVVAVQPALADARDAAETLTVPFTVSGSLTAPRLAPGAPPS